METYRIIRFFRDGDNEVIEGGLTREEAEEHCRDPESSSRTCTKDWGRRLLAARGAWFDGFAEE
jgi:hypothetical protein